MGSPTADIWSGIVPRRQRIAAAFLLMLGCDPSSFDRHDRGDSASGSTVDDATADGGMRMDATANGDQPGSEGGTLDGAPTQMSSGRIDSTTEPMAQDGSIGGSKPDSRDAAQASADAAQISDDAAANQCGDTLRDPRNCGVCGYDCSAPSAVVSCVNGSCNRTCASGFDDCNNDVVHGALGNGCETRVDKSINNCGGCRRRCVAPDDGFATCADQVCTGHTLRLVDPAPGALHGNPTGGGPFSITCLPGEVVTGISGLGDDYIVYAIRAHCARLRLTRASGVTSVSTVPTWMTDLAGGDNLVPVASFTLPCPPNMVVTKVSGSTAYYNTPVPATVPSLKRLSITCSAVKVDAALELSLSVGPTSAIGRDEVPPIEVFDSPCAANGAVGGFSGRSGAYLDSVATHCGRLELRAGAAGTVTSPAGAMPDVVDAE